VKSQENAINKAKSLYNKHREKLLYLFFGGMTTIISIVSKLILFYVIPNEPAWENIFVITLSWIISVEFAFIVNKKFVFQKLIKP